jgi:hypothetical protein
VDATSPLALIGHRLPRAAPEKLDRVPHPRRRAKSRIARALIPVNAPP